MITEGKEKADITTEEGLVGGRKGFSERCVGKGQQETLKEGIMIKIHYVNIKINEIKRK